jgi:hypothetical protein
MRIDKGRAALAFAAFVGITSATALTIEGCSSDDTTAGGPLDGGGTDATVDGAVDARADSPADGGTADAPVDSPPDAPLDAPAMADFIPAVVRTFCARISSCCLNPSTFDNAKCFAVLNNPNSGDLLGLPAFEPSTDGGAATYNPATAADCLSRAAALSCGLVPTAQVKALESVCYGAFTGTRAIGAAGCKSSIDCVTGAFCDLTVDGGACAALKGANQPCSDPNSLDCSYLGIGNPANFCNFPADGGASTCQPKLGPDASCNANNDCIDNNCTGVCDDNVVISDPGVPNGLCDLFTIKDAGGGG